MRDFLVEQTRRKASLKRGGDLQRVDAEKVEFALPEPDEDVLALEEALSLLEAEDPRKGEIVNLRYFAGMTNQETAEVLGLSVRTIEDQWNYIRRWLHRQLRKDRD